MIARAPQPVDIGGRLYHFVIVWVDPEHIRAIAQTVRFTVANPPAGASAVVTELTREHLSRDEALSRLTVAGSVRDVAVSARIITLDAPVENVTTIALTGEPRLIAADGNDIALRDIKPGVSIKAFGQRGDADALIASQVVVLDTNPSDRR